MDLDRDFYPKAHLSSTETLLSCEKEREREREREREGEREGERGRERKRARERSVCVPVCMHVCKKRTGSTHQHVCVLP